MPRPAFHIVPIALCVLALFVAGAVGTRAGYLCRCSGKPVPTQASHCHDSHVAHCHHDDAASDSAHGEDGCPGEREDHQVVMQDVESRAAETAAKLTAPHALVAFLPAARVLSFGGAARQAARTSWAIGESPPFGVAVGRTVVLRI